ncbi:NlpC/P60 family protein [Enterococcus alishanensis]
MIVVMMVISMLMAIFMATNANDCSPVSESGSVSNVDDSAVPTSVEAFVQSHKEAYILSWKAGGFLPSASIAQTMVENGFNFTNPSGTSLWQAHNMGGVKTSSKSNFPITLSTFGDDAVDITGTKPGTNVGDNTGGAYTWFKDYNAGIVGKAEFMAHQTLYTGAINNTDGIGTLTAIYKGGWATDPTYLVKLQNAYQNLGTKFQWLDQEAIAQHGTAPYDGAGSASGSIPSNSDSESESMDSSKRAEIVELAESRLGIPYVWGGRNWDSGMDCSGLTMLVYKKVGIEIPATSETQSSAATRVSKEDVQRGDLVFWGEPGRSSHVAIYVGDNQMIEEPQPGEVCQKVPLRGDYWFGTFEGLGSDDSSSKDDACEVSETNTSGQVVGENSAPTLSVPDEYEGKLTLPTPDNKNYAGNNYPMGQCTWGAFNRMAQIGRPIEWFSGDGGNGGSWGASARARGYTVIKGKPEVGWAASFYGGLAGSTPPYGHIAVVEYVNEDGSILISETNVVSPGSGTRSWRVINSATVKEVEFIQGGK